MGMSDNAKWLILAVASSVFIGMSFILKKKKRFKQDEDDSTVTRAGLSFFFFFFLFIQLGIL